MTLIRRVKKGPGRRPQSAKRRRFMELRARGWSIRAAAREVGVARTTGTNWATGYKTYRKDGTVGWVPPLDALAVRQISARFLSMEERIEIAELALAGVSVRGIARQLGRSASTISRELRRDTTKSGTTRAKVSGDQGGTPRHGNRLGGSRDGYRPFEAHRQATSLRARHHLRRIERDAQLRSNVAGLLTQRWSPQQISRHLRRQHPDEPAKWLCHESIYQAVYQPGSVLVRPSVLAPHRQSPLRTGRDHRRAHQHVDRRRPRFQQPMLTIHQRPFEPTDRSEAGHWEGDLIIGKAQGSAIGTLVERQTRMVRLLHVPQRDGESLHAALVARMSDLPAPLLRSITWDQGTEMAGHLAIAKSLGATIYFCDSHSPWQRGSNENTNGLLRDYFPKSTDLSAHSVQHLLAVENEINTRPRMVLNDKTPAELFKALLASKNQSVLRR